MTLIAFATYGNHAEFITDTVSYTKQAETLGRTSKAVAFPHLDAAVITQGSTIFGNHAKSAAWQLAGQLSTFDEVVDHYPMALDFQRRSILADEESASEDDLRESTAFLIGFSARDEKFVAYAFALEEDFRPRKVSRWVMPAPWNVRPTAVELKRCRGWMEKHPRVDHVMESWSQADPMSQPRTIDEWVSLAVDAREHRALDHSRFGHVIVAGDVFHTRIGRGEMTTRKIHTFDDSGEEFLRLIAQTSHPLALAAPCPVCDSGRAYGECHGTNLPTVTA